MDSAKTLQKIVDGSGKSSEEVKGLVGKKMEKFSGLLTESGAAMMVAKELGIELNLDQKPLERLQVSQLSEGMNNVEVLARVMHVFSPRQFEKNGKKGVLCSLIVADESGEIRLTVWGREVKKVEEQVQKGTVLLLKNCYVSSYNEKPQLNLSYNGKMAVEPGTEEGLPPKADKVVALNALSESESDVSVVVRVLRVFPEKSFAREKGQGRLANFVVGDGTTVLRATAWDDMVSELSKIAVGEAVKIEGVYTKKGLNGVDLNLGYRARILRNPENGDKLPAASEMQGIEFKEKKIAELVEGDRFVRLNVEIAGIQPGNLRFNVCPKCGKKVEATEGSFLCSECGEVQPDIRAVIGLRLKDKSGEINAVLFAKAAEIAMGLDKEGLKKRLEVNTAEQIIAELLEEIVGKKAVASGFARKNKFSNELEFNAREFSLQAQ